MPMQGPKPRKNCKIPIPSSTIKNHQKSKPVKSANKERIHILVKNPRSKIQKPSESQTQNPSEAAHKERLYIVVPIHSTCKILPKMVWILECVILECWISVMVVQGSEASLRVSLTRGCLGSIRCVTVTRQL